jgi:hypothetical protein
MGKRRRSKNASIQWMKYVVVMVVFAFLAGALAIYFMPFVAYYQIESAIIAKDASRLASCIDLDEMKRNLKKQKGQRVIKELKHDDAREQDLADLSIQWAALSSDQAIDQAISTEGFYVILARGGADGKKREPVRAPKEISAYEAIKKMMATGSFHYRNISRFEVNIKDEKGRYVEYFSFIFARDGLNWRLTNVMLPLF